MWEWMVLSKSDYDPTQLVKGGVNPVNDPFGTVTLIVGSLIALSVAIWAFSWANAKGSNVVNNLMGSLTGGVASTSENPRVV